MNLFRLLAQVKYYFDTKNAAAPIAFIGPHIIAGGGIYRRTDNFPQTATLAAESETLNAFGFNFGGGLELTIKPKKVYLQSEFLGHIVNFKDSEDNRFNDIGIPNKTGIWYTATIGILWTW